MRVPSGVMSRQFMLFGLVLTLVVLILASLDSLRVEMLEIRNDRERSLAQTEDDWLPLLTRAVWVLEDEDIDLILRAIHQQPQVESLSLEILGGETRSRGVDPEHRGKETTWLLRYVRDSKPVEIASLTVVTHVPTVGEVAAVALPVLIPGLLVRILIIVIPFFALVHFAVARQLIRLSRSVRTLATPSSEAGSTLITLNRRKIFRRPDELDEVVESFNLLLGRMHAERSIRQAREQELELSVEQSQFLLREVHHRVKNNLQMLISLFSLQSHRLGPSERAVIRDAERRVRSLALVHVQLYQDRSITGVELIPYAQALLDALLASTQEGERPAVRATVSGDNVEMPLDKAIPLALILNELVTNALKHAFSPGRPGTLAIAVTREGPTVRITVTDDGRGAGDDFSLDDPESFGLTIVTTLIGQIRGTLRRDTTVSRGTRFEIVVPVG